MNYSKNRTFPYLVLISILSFSPFVLAGDFDALTQKVKKIELENGLRIIVIPNDLAPVFSAQVWVGVGGADELPGASGAAHLLEHMAFKGTEKIGLSKSGDSDRTSEKKLIAEYDSLYESEREMQTESGQKRLVELSKKLEEMWDLGAFTTLYQERGASGLNAGTSKDYTVYTISLPTSELEFWFYMESERLLRPVFRQFYKELDVVLEERRMRTDDNPSGKLYEALLGTAYRDHPYTVPTIGWKSDLNALKKEDAYYLHGTYYRPDNIVITIAGDIDIKNAERFSKKYFGRISNPKTTIPKRRVFPEDQNGERRVSVMFDAEPEFMVAYHIPTTPSIESLHFTLLGAMLDGGRSSPFQKVLIKNEEIVSSISVSEAPGHRYDPVFLISATPRQGISTEKALDRIQTLLDSIQGDLLNESMLVAAKKQIKMSILKSLQSNSGIARYLGIYELLFGGWDNLFKELERIDTVQLSEVKLSASRFLRVSNRTLADIVPKSDSGQNRINK
ncbi:MAG TPA: pitrilysin family protein [Oligoflexia bacterium]|nr:pitrilysin family protein [Oligoflexia bacterium]HMP48416.1 pitrilysin family protein [Oligoflexia bacterium]